MARQTFASGWLRDEQGSDLITRIAQTSVAESWFKPIPMAGELKTEPRTGAVGIAVIAKGGTYAEDVAGNDSVTLTARKFGTAIRIADEDIADNLVDVVNSKKTDWGTSFAIAFDNACIGTSGASNGTTIPYTSIYKSLITADAGTGYSANANYVKSIAAVSYDDLNTLVGLVENQGYFNPSRSGFIAPYGFKQILRGLKDDQHRPLWQPAIAEGAPETFMGYPIKWSMGSVVSAAVNSAQAVTLAGAGVKGTAGNPLIVFANADLLYNGKRSGPESVVIPGLDGASALTDETLLKMRARRAFAVAHEFGVAVLEICTA
jgi:HK97 family phage major capsid protein